MSTLRPYQALLARDLKLAFRRRADLLLPLGFAVLVVLLFGIALGGTPERLAPVSAPVIWVTVLLAGFLSLDGLFRPDVDDGTLDHWLAGPTSIVGLMYAKALAHWLLYGVGLTLSTPLLAMLLNLPANLLPVMLAALGIGTLGATQIGIVAAALTARLRRSGILLALIVMPLYLPLLILCPGLTMRAFAEERRSGTVELLLTLPFSELELILGKYFSALVFLGLALATTLVLPIIALYVSSPDFMVLLGSYLGAWLSGSAYIALGLYISWLTRDQITAFLLSFLACLFIYLLGYQPVLQFFGPLKELLGFLSVSWHSDSLAAGLLDTRDLLYYISFSALFIYLNKISIQNFRRGN